MLKLPKRDGAVLALKGLRAASFIWDQMGHLSSRVALWSPAPVGWGVGEDSVCRCLVLPSGIFPVWRGSEVQ
jgi:hypothetical protein